MSDEKAPPPASTKAPAAKPAAKRPAGKKSDVFGDPGLSSADIDPLPAPRRTRGFAAVAGEHLALALMPMSLALFAVLRPLVDSGKGALVSMFVGIVCAALVIALASSGLVRYGILPGVWARPMLGPLGAKAFTLLRSLVIATFLGHAAWLAAQTLLWGALCAWPQLVPFASRVPVVAGESLTLIALTLALFVLVVRKPLGKWAFVPALVLVVALGFMPGAASLHALMAGAEPRPSFDAWALAFVWGVCLFATTLPTAREARSPIGYGGAVVAAVCA